LFSHFRYDTDLSPMKELSHLYDVDEAMAKYRKMTAFEKLMEELRATSVAAEPTTPSPSINIE